MKFKNVTFADGSEEVTFDVSTTQEEVAFLVNHAVNNLLSEGIISLNQNGGPEQEVELREVSH